MSATRILHRSLARATYRHLSSKASAPPPPPPPPDYLARINLASSSSARSDPHVGPFPLPPGGGGDRDARINAAGKKWQDLGATQKVGRATTQFTSLLVVLAGGSLAVLVLYATGTELWSEASPTRVFEDCVERVRASEELNSILLPPLTFHGAASSSRMRRNRRISSSLTVDPIDGSETMIVRFWVEGTEKRDNDEDKTYWDHVKKWVGPLIWEDSTKPGSYVPRPSNPKPAPPPPPPEQPKTWGGWLVGSVASAFGGIVPRARTDEHGHREASLFKKARRPALGEYSTAECVAELKKDPETGNFVYKQLFVAVPDTRHPNSYRIPISTDVVGEPTRGLDRLRFWQRTKTVAA